MQTKHLVFLYYLLAQTPLLAQTNTAIRLETGAKGSLSHFMDANNYPIDDFFQGKFKLTYQQGIVIERVSTQKRIGFELGFYRSQYGVFANIDGIDPDAGIYKPQVPNGFGDITRYYNQWDIPIRSTFILYQKNNFVKNKQKEWKMEQNSNVTLRATVGLVYMKLATNSLSSYPKKDTIYSTAPDKTIQKLDFSYDLRGHSKWGGIAFETGLNIEVAMNKHLSITIVPRAAWGITPMAAYYLDYIVVATNGHSNSGDGNSFAKGDNISLNIGLQYKLF
jgi:hypothetical protein